MDELSDSERKVISDGEQIKMLTMHNGWGMTRAIMKQWVDEALSDCEQCRSSDDRLRANLQIRWQERKEFLKMIDKWQHTVVEQRKQLLTDIAMSKGMTPLEAIEAAEKL